MGCACRVPARTERERGASLRSTRARGEHSRPRRARHAATGGVRSPRICGARRGSHGVGIALLHNLIRSLISHLYIGDGFLTAVSPHTALMNMHSFSRCLIRSLRDERGSVTAEYAIATMAAVGFAGLLVVILRGDEVKSILTDMVRRALGLA